MTIISLRRVSILRKCFCLNKKAGGMEYIFDWSLNKNLEKLNKMIIMEFPKWNDKYMNNRLTFNLTFLFSVA